MISSEGWQTYFVKGQIVHSLDFVGHVILTAVIQFCLWNIKHGQYVNEQVWPRSNKTLFTKTYFGPNLSVFYYPPAEK